MAVNHTTDAEIVDVLRLVREHGSQRAAARAAGVDSTVVANRIRLAKERGLTADTIIRDPLASAKIEIATLKRSLRELQRKEDTAADIRRTIYQIAERDPQPPKWLTQHKKGSGTPGAPMTNWSDWHYGEVVRKGEVGGLNEYNSEIAAERIQKLADRTIRLVKGFAFKEAGKAVEFPGIVVGLGGDMISGFIHEELEITNDRTPNQCIDELTDLIAAALKQLANEFGTVFVPCVVGNHGRTHHKPRMKGRVFESFEWNLYCNLKRFFKDDSRIQFEISEGADIRFNCMGHWFLWTHGDALGAMGGDGMIGSIGPIQRGIIKTKRAYAGIGQPVDTVVLGHYHQELWLPGGIVNNSLKGDDEYARLKMRAEHSRPGQSLWFVHEEQGITARLQVNVDDPKKPRKRAPWVLVPR
jgi:transposase-like protein